jgi:hypothetical protein
VYCGGISGGGRREERGKLAGGARREKGGELVELGFQGRDKKEREREQVVVRDSDEGGPLPHADLVEEEGDKGDVEGFLFPGEGVRAETREVGLERSGPEEKKGAGRRGGEGRERG